jgi:hypothetical protein
MKRLFLSIAIVLAAVWLMVNQSRFAEYFSRTAETPSVHSELSSKNERMPQAMSAQAVPAQLAKGLTLQLPELTNLGGERKQIQLCGIGNITVAEFPFRVPAIRINSQNEVINSISRELARSSVERDRALGWYLQAAMAGEAAAERARIQDPGCGVATPSADLRQCTNDPFQASEEARVNAAAPLVEIALKTTDPAVYATAFHLCTSAPANARGVCAQITADAWVKLDPENMLPQVLARNPGPHGAGYALAPANAADNEKPIKAKNYNKRHPQFEKVMDHTVFTSEPVYIQSAIADWLMEQQSRFDFSGSTAISYHCRAAEATRDVRAAPCKQMAELIAHDGLSASDVMIAIVVGENVKLSSGLLDNWKAERTRLFAAAGDEMSDPRRYSCEGMTEAVQQTRSVLRLGSRAAVATMAGK